MAHSSPLPASLIARFNTWKQEHLPAKAELFADLASGQNPMAMVISCCDSRVQSTEIFDVPAGSFFIHRNIANLVPPYQAGGDAHGTASALEYAVKALKVPHLIIMGHSACGGVQACYDMCENDVAAADAGFEFVGHWLENLRPAYKQIPVDADDPLVELGRQGVLASLENLMDYPFIKDAVAQGGLQLHGLWHDIGAAELYAHNSESGAFEPL
ncbi:MAG: carbonic anhydrase [Parvibaculales bacterium]|nr:carbonic anhydrase [Alphaproteobacteria bacterium]